jgi:HEAT repeat protein
MRARKLSLIVPIGAALIFVAIAHGTETPPLPQGVMDTLGALDSAPTTVELNAAFMGSASTTAQSLAMISADSTNDIGVRLRAIHALGQYCPLPGNPPPCAGTDPSHVALTSLITTLGLENLQANGGADLLLLRAAIETLGPLQVASDASALVGLLDHPSRDIRASTANALRDLCDPNDSVVPLRTRLEFETVDQVKLAITDALSVLGECTPPP